MSKISTYAVDGTPSLDDKLIGTDVNNNSETKNYLISDIIDLVPPYLEVFNGLTAQGIDNTTTSVMKYGVNVFTTSTPTDYCTKLPQPVTGKSTRVVNMSDMILLVHPSNIGGKINNLPVDTPLAIPNDGKAYEFVCTENPLPGGWNTISAPAIAQYALNEISISHTQNTDTYAYGYGNSQSIYSTPQWQLAVTASESTGNIVLSPSSSTWLTLPVSALMTKVKIYSNFVLADGASEPHFSRFVVFKPAANVLNVWTAVDSDINLDGSQVVGTSTLSSPPEVGDTGTYT